MALRFRNLDATPDDPVEQWGAEGVLAAIERGGSRDWARVLRAVDEDRGGTVRAFVAQAVECADPGDGITILFRRHLDRHARRG